MPALQRRMSRREDWEVNCLAALETEAREARSHSRKVIWVSGWAAWTSLIRAAAVLELRPLK